MLVSVVSAAGVLAVLTLLPGPDTAVVMRRALVAGRAAGLRTAAGVACGLLVWGALVVAGVAALLTAVPQVYLVLKVLGVLYLLLLGVQALRGGAARRDDEPDHPTPGRPFTAGLMTNLLNPKIAVFYTVMLPTLAPAGLGAWGMPALVVVHVALTMAWLTGFTYLLGRAAAWVQRPRVRRAVERVTGVVLVGFAVRLAADH